MDDTGKFLVDEDVLKEEGMKDFEQYACCPGEQLLPDYFLEDLSVYNTIMGQTIASDGAPPPPTGGGGPPAALFNSIRPMINETVVNETGGTFLFNLKGAHPGQWFLDLKNGSGSVGPASEDQAADVTMTMDSDDMVKMFRGKLKPTAAFMGGKLKISGSIQLAMKLDKLMGQISKL